MSINALVERIEAARAANPPSDLLNGPHDLCSCLQCSSGKAPTEPKSRLAS